MASARREITSGTESDSYYRKPARSSALERREESLPSVDVSRLGALSAVIDDDAELITGVMCA